MAHQNVVSAERSVSTPRKRTVNRRIRGSGEGDRGATGGGERRSVGSGLGHLFNRWQRGRVSSKGENGGGGQESSKQPAAIRVACSTNRPGLLLWSPPAAP